MIRAVVFDMDGVLIDSEPLHFATTNTVLAPHGVSLAPEQYAAYVGMGEREFFEALIERFALNVPAERLRRERLALGLGRMAAEPMLPRAGVLEAIVALTTQGLRLGLASSATRAQVELVVAKLGLARALGVRVCVEDVARAKPAPDVFLEAARRLDVPPAECLVIEDAVLGVRAARAAGMAVVAYPPLGDPGDAHRAEGALEVLQSLAQLDAEELDRLSPAG